jgi:phenylacetate-coenzyme A ligase PaaK-like adenylate-forming protein
VRLSPVEPWTARKISGARDLSPAELEAWQMARVRRVVRYARARSSFYARRLAGVDASSMERYADMERLPFTRQEDVSDGPESFLCVSPSDVTRVVTLLTSGRTGGSAKPKRIFFTQDDLDLSADFLGNGMTTIIGPGERVAVMMSNETENSIADLLKKGIERYGGEAEILGHMEDADSSAARAAGADCIVGVPSEILRLCRSHPQTRPRGVLLSADYVPEAVISAVKSAWGCGVYTHYGMTETCYGCAVQCDAGGSYHVRHSDLLVEIVDPVTGRRRPDGAEGEIVVTTFAHRAMPLIRYRTGDIASIDAGKCPCGGVLPRLSKARGRFCNVISVGGVEARIEDLDELIYSVPEVLGYQARTRTYPDGAETLRLTLDTTKPIPEERISDRIKPYLRDKVDVEIRFEKLAPTIGRSKRKIETAEGEGADARASSTDG